MMTFAQDRNAIHGHNMLCVIHSGERLEIMDKTCRV
jgi:hypothetical protein